MRRSLFYLVNCWVVAGWLLCSCNLFTVQSPVYCNLDFEKGIEGSEIPYSWQYQDLGGYFIKWVANAEEGGKCLRIHSEKPDLKWFAENDSLAAGVFSLSLPGELVRGKRLEVSAMVKTKSVTQYARLVLSILRDTLVQEVNDPASGLRATKGWTRLTVECAVDSTATEVYLSGMMSGRGTAWFDDFEIRIDGKRLRDADLPAEPTAEEIEWLRAHIHPLRTIDPGTDTEDLQPLFDSLKGASIVALGGVTSGSYENNRLRHRITQALVEQEGFNLLTIEGGNSRAYRVNRYTPPVPMQVNYWDFQALTRWIEEFNGDSPRLLWSSFQGYPVNAAYVELLKALEPYPKAKAELDAFLLAFAGRMSKEELIRKHLLQIAAYVRQYITNAEEREWLVQNTVSLEQQMVKVWWREDLADYNIDEVIRYMQHTPDQRMVLYSANPIIRKNGNSLGVLLDERLGEAYVSVAFAFNEGTYHAFTGTSYASGKQKLLKAYPGTYEYYFRQLNEPLFLIDLREVRKDISPDSEWLRRPARFRELGAIKTTTEFTRSLLSSEYDILIFIDQPSVPGGRE
ncbi:erythromycin esterase family protein [Parabacteroides sp. PF5-6]|uniref:erythromycin esterase family protein n=1 Tax=Parabacteroides sp. PF5-6 TaxID=1742403 RepID=UPI002405B8A7|nr:erythromycin esterase family protein [Parabacteroides sp. PF5-6]MDF9830551.1 erythromycin esterase [Parabacteroides sp. PF5-6]